MWNVPLQDLASLQWPQRQEQQRRWTGLWLRPGPDTATHALAAWWGGLRDVLAWPFDAARHQHAAGVRFGAWPRSLLESQRFEQQLGLWENLTLGPLARSR